MSILKAITKPFLKACNHVRRELFFRNLRKRLKNKDFTLITNNCFGGIVYHQLGLPFLSPTINLGFTFEGYLAFARDIPYYLSCEIEDISHEHKLPFPVGRIVPKDDQHIPIMLLFGHYHSFEEAVTKWKKRAKRVNMDNLAFIYYHIGKPRPNLFREFEALPGNKMMILQEDMPDCGLEHYCYMRSYDPAKNINHFFDRVGYSGRRVCNYFDFVSFLNGNYTGPRNLGTLPQSYFDQPRPDEANFLEVPKEML